MRLKEKIHGTGSTIKDQLDHVKKDSIYLKEVLQSKDVIFFKTDAVAILVRKKGNEKEFFDAFDKITKEGYRMMFQEKVVDVPGIKMTLAYVYYFQNRKFIG